MPANEFDRVHFGKLFTLLLKMKMPAVVIRLLLNNYLRQSLGCISNNMHVSNGVKQGGVLSPLLFNVYVDEY